MSTQQITTDIAAEANMTPEALQSKIVQLRAKIQKVSAFFDYEEVKESVPNAGSVFIHRYLPRFDHLDRVSSDVLERATEMALWQINYYSRESKNINKESEENLTN